MHKYVYDIFKHWYRGGTVYLYSDPHFDDDELDAIVENRPTSEEQVKRINSKLGKNDTIIFLGDIGNVEWIKKIRGYKVLIMGNHDKGANHYKRFKSIKYFSPNIADGSEEDAMLKHASVIGYKYKGIEINEFGQSRAKYEDDNNLFDEVYEGCLMISPKIILSHEPVFFPFAYNIHGHTHDNAIATKNSMCVCAEHINYTPISLNDIICSGVTKNIPNIHRVAINNAIERKLMRE